MKWPPIVDLETFNKAQERLSLNKNKYKPSEWKSYPFPLTEILVCGECGKHFYYGHSRRLGSDSETHLKRCKLENIRAPKIEEVVLQSLKQVIDNPALIKTWLDFYAAKNTNELPAIEARLKVIDADVSTHKRRIENLTARLADLPPELPADTIYRQIQEFTLKVKELEKAKADLSVQTRSLNSGVIDRSELLFRIKHGPTVPAAYAAAVFANSRNLNVAGSRLEFGRG